MGSSNMAVLTNSHKIVAAKRRAKREQIKEIVFDATARREFLTGFHKRKLEKKEAAKKKALEREKQERLEARREKRQMLAERAVQNAAETERAYGGVVEDEEEWDGISVSGPVDKGKGKQKEEEYEYEEQIATVTVVEDFDPDELIHGPHSESRTPLPSDVDANRSSTSHPVSESQAQNRPSRGVIASASMGPRPSANGPAVVGRNKSKPKPKDIKYQTNAARKADKMKQRRRHTEKAERAGGKASRKSGGGRTRR
ncbi:hypothetical protein EVJ58_g3089 [Rhodofomes roseus]|uniref:Nucleolar protein 12 n=1 Tax=Rhodofomes roseus TaxID=34475 RepID=A0A4Y9YQ94_9APHY|nr:hypothetical protein EVJ58_g3089 [Rhodofomes roseus]